jgi:hypothetical protein
MKEIEAAVRYCLGLYILTRICLFTDLTIYILSKTLS